MNPGLGVLGTRRKEIRCEVVVETWRTQGGNSDVGDVFYQAFEKSRKEINIATKGG